jgi:single-strand DNA-binding protein
MPALRSVNKVILVGNLTRDGEVSYTPSGTPVCFFTVATNEAWKDAKGEQHEEASFHSVNAWGKFGENLAKILQKGMKVYIEGNLTYREKRDEAGKLVSKDARIRADSVIILDRSSGRPASHEEMEASQGDNTKKTTGGEFDLDAIAQGLDDAKTASKSTASAPTPISEDDLPF